MPKKKNITPAKIKNLIKKYLRNASLKSPYNNLTKERAKVDSALYSCEKCGKYCYEGVSNKNYEALVKKYPKHNVVREKVQVDHLDAVIAPEIGFVDWNTYIERLFVTDDKMQCLCPSCHKEKSAKENEIRKTTRKNKR